MATWQRIGRMLVVPEIDFSLNIEQTRGSSGRLKKIACSRLAR
jgi:hypothetical protein